MAGIVPEFRLEWGLGTEGVANHWRRDGDLMAVYHCIPAINMYTYRLGQQLAVELVQVSGRNCGLAQQAPEGLLRAV